MMVFVRKSQNSFPAEPRLIAALRAAIPPSLPRRKSKAFLRGVSARLTASKTEKFSKHFFNNRPLANPFFN